MYLKANKYSLEVKKSIMEKNFLKIKPDRTLFPLGDLYGVFFEDINHAADGGLYAEMVRNRAFEFAPIDRRGYHALTAWSLVKNPGCEAALSVRTENPVSLRNPHYAVLTIQKGTAGIANEGYHKGMYIQKGASYYASFWCRRDSGLEYPVSVSLEKKDGTVLAGGSVRVTSEWKKYEITLTAEDTCDGILYVLRTTGVGNVFFDFVSLFPSDTFKGRRNGLRRDLAQAVCDLHPKFMRFPGGCLIHDGNLDKDARDSLYRWKNTIGPLEDRPARAGNWGYNQTLGLGYFEYFLFCEDIGAKPIPVLPAAYNPHDHEAVPIEEMGEWIEDALDLIEFANGPVSTTWGKIRADLGHPEPFGMEYIAIGNEELGLEFVERYPYFQNAIRDKYPEIKIISSCGPFADGYDFDMMWEEANRAGADLVDEHYYMAPDWMLKHTHRYDSYPRTGAKVFLGEYASLDNRFKNALYEAAFMTGLERNGDKVSLACYAPLFCNKDYVNWKPDMIWYNHKKMVKSINYYVQQMFLTHQGTEEIASDFQSTGTDTVIPIPDICGRIGFASENPSVIIKQISVNGITLEHDAALFYNKKEKSLSTDSLKGEIVTLEEKNKQALMYPASYAGEYTISFDFVKTSGKGQVKLLFGYEDGHYYQWEIGGWANDMSSLGKCDITTAGKKQIAKYGGINVGRTLTIEENVPYHGEVKISGRHITAALNGKVYQDFEEIDTVIHPLYYTVSKDKDAVYVKVVNVKPEPSRLILDITGEKQYGAADIVSLQSDNPAAVNNFVSPNAVVPSHERFPVEENHLSYEISASSVTVITIK